MSIKKIDPISAMNPIYNNNKNKNNKNKNGKTEELKFEEILKMKKKQMEEEER